MARGGTAAALAPRIGAALAAAMLGATLLGAGGARAQDEAAEAAPEAAPLPIELPEGTAEARRALFKRLGADLKALSEAAKAGDPVDADAARARALGSAALARTIPSLFPPGTENLPGSGALPEIWERPEEFAARAGDLEALLLEFAGEEGALSAEALGAAVARVGSSCNACHRPFREKH